jgi:hypothetical protein
MEDLFGQDLLDAETHRAVFGDLPSSLQRALRTPEVGDLVLQLLDAGWRRGQISSRVNALPPSEEGSDAIVALLRGFLDQLPPDARHREEKAHRAQAAATRAAAEEPATEDSRRQWVAQIRAELALPRGPKERPSLQPLRPCAMCGREGVYFVTRGVRLCSSCVSLLQSGAVRAPDPDDGQLAG